MAALPPHYSSWFGKHRPKYSMSIATGINIVRIQRTHIYSEPHYLELTISSKNWKKRALLSDRFDFLGALSDVFLSSTSSFWCFFNNRKETKCELEAKSSKVNSTLETSSGKSSNVRIWTNVLLAVNILAYVTQIATKGKLILWGAKINSLIDKGQLWRLATSSILHANIGHLMVNSYSLNSIGPAVEGICGPKRFLAVYIASAIASSAMSYRFCKAPAVGASGAIFGLVGSFTVFILRHRSLNEGGWQDLQHIAQVIVLNLVIGTLTKGIDNWGHLGGLLGGAAMSWFVGPAWEFVHGTGTKPVFVDRAPIRLLFHRQRILK
ncbi:hypothetical protein AMTRI_Chr04g186230 [Amborella trichopoda]